MISQDVACYSPAGGFRAGEVPCSSAEVCGGAVEALVAAGFSSGETLELLEVCWVERGELLGKERPSSPFLQFGEVSGKLVSL